MDKYGNWEKLYNHIGFQASQRSLDEIGKIIFSSGDLIYVPGDPGENEVRYIEIDLTEQVDGKKQVFNLPSDIENDNVHLYYAGLKQVKDINYTVDMENKTLTTLFDTPPDSDGNRRLIVLVENIHGLIGGGNCLCGPIPEEKIKELV